MPETWTLSLIWPRIARRTSPARSPLAAGADVSDQALFERVRLHDDHAAFGQLVSRYRARVTALVRRMLSASQTALDPEDIAQEAFLAAYRGRAGFQAGAPFRSWLYGIAVNRCLDHLRAGQREGAVVCDPLPSDDEALRDPGPSADPLENLLSRLELEEVERGIAALPPNLRAVLILRYLDDLSYEEIASACRMPLGTVKTNLFRARMELARRLTNAETI